MSTPLIPPTFCPEDDDDFDDARRALSTVLVVLERELRDGVLFADFGEEEVRHAVERVVDESIFDGGFLAFGVSGRRAQSTPDCFRCGVGVEFSQSETGNGECLLNVCGVCRI